MKAGEASETARRVAAHRLNFDRVPVAYGNAGEDDRLARDVAGDVTGASSETMTAYLAARTKFFDHVVVGALDRGVTQVVIAGAGYDGRALRYAKAGVQWFEIDHPDTQRDKRQRLERLGIPTDHITFIAADFAQDDVSAAADGAAHNPALPSLFVCEGVAIYLERPVLTSLLSDLRDLACPDSLLAISLSVSSSNEAEAVRRAAFQNAVAALGEPARTVLSPDEVDGLLTTTGWRIAITGASPVSPRARLAGLVVLEPAAR